ncbi:MAG: NAD(P)/FAD-dependent oxidoreductase [Clostridia bacterium]|nr:NAD(P)/FAD-dependent oxidoreductase [Clostridia bacterium]
MYDTAIVGGGAAGLCAAIFAARRGKQVLLLERLPRVGKKLLSTGNGRCNISNRQIALRRYHGKSVSFATYALEAFSVSDTIRFFESIGLPVMEGENGKLYPQSLQSNAVLDLMRLELQRLSVVEHTNSFITGIVSTKNGFSLSTEDGKTYSAKTVIVATGGKAAPSMGTDGQGYTLLTALGHSIVPPIPSLVQVKTTPSMHALKGTKHVGTASVYAGDKLIRQESGEILFTDYGLSGPPIFNLSRIVSAHASARQNVTISINFFPGMDKASISELLNNRRKACPHLTGECFLYGLLPKNIAREIIKRATNHDTLVQLLFDFRLSASGVMPWANAQVTAGGICTDEVCPETMESYFVPGLFLCGEVLDIDGDCGGFNLQWAWSSAYVAAANI